MCTDNRGLRIVFDIDDTISRVKVKGDYAGAEEITAVTERLRILKEAGHTIVLHTARGMVSCGGDIDKAREKNEGTLTTWLADHDIPYDEIWWGKPYADVYVDDKAVSAGDFVSEGTKEMSGFSGARVTRIGRMVVKQAENVSEQARWYKESERMCFPYHRPDIYSCNFDKLYMGYIPGRQLSKIRDEKEVTWHIGRITQNVLLWHRHATLEGENEVEWYKEYVGSRAEEISVKREQVEADIEATRELLKERTFCHGDLSMSNIIIGDDGRRYLIDPSPKNVSSWLLDASKLRASLRGLDDILTGRKPQIREKGLVAMELLINDEAIIRAIELLERGHWIRVARYAKVLGREDVFEGLMRQIREWYG